MAQWVNVGKIQGPKGDTGPQGPQGPEGPQGPKGDNGLDGKDGKDASVYRDVILPDTAMNSFSPKTITINDVDPEYVATWLDYLGIEYNDSSNYRIQIFTQTSDRYTGRQEITVYNYGAGTGYKIYGIFNRATNSSTAWGKVYETQLTEVISDV